MNRDERVEPPAAVENAAPELRSLRALADERAVLLQMAELAARPASPAEVFATVVTEASRLLGGLPMTLTHFEGPRELVVVAARNGQGSVGERVAFESGTLPDRVLRGATVVRIDDYAKEPDAAAALAEGLTAAVAAPVTVSGAVWGMLTATSPSEPLATGADEMLKQCAQFIAVAVGGNQARTEFRALADEQAALRRIAELSARGTSADDVLHAVAVEGSRLSGVDFTTVLRYEADGSTEIVALDGAPAGVAIGMRASGAGDGAVQRLWRTGRASRVDDLAEVSGRWPHIARRAAFSASVAAPILLQGTLWGALVVVSREQPLPRGIEDHLLRFADRVGTAISAVDARLRLRALADEQAALRLVAELVARGAAPEEVFVAVTNEVSALLGDLPVALMLYDDEGAAVVATCNCPAPVGLHVPLSAGTAVDQVVRTGGPAHIDSYEDTALAGVTQEVGITSTTAVPITVEGRVRATLVSSNVDPTSRAAVEARLAQFAELAAVAIANAETQAKLTASRARVVASADEARRRLQRDVHDGAQQRLVHAVIALKMARNTVEVGSAAADFVQEALTNVERASSELRDIVHGILPRALTYGGLRTGLESLVGDLALPVDVRVSTPRLPAAVETTVYFVVAESLTNAVKHAQARAVSVCVDLEGDTVVIDVRDDGVGGADPTRGTGLTGLLDRIDAAEGTLTITSPPGDGTAVHAELPARFPGDRTPGPSAPGCR
ncbi:MAG TPA: GAF domain-containing protein [Pseudonocardia sp.]